MKKTFQSLLILLSGLIFLSVISSCGSKRLSYFNNIKTDTVIRVQPYQMETKISRNDILQITISTLDQATTQLYSGDPSGYLVDETGIIKLPLIGAIKAEGQTKRQLATYITDQLVGKKIAIDAFVTVRITNFKITVLGEVGRPGIIPVPNERITLPEALGTAGDLNVFAKRNKVLLIREVDGNRIYKRFNLNNDDMFNPEIYNLRNQDIIYVAPNDVKGGTSNRALQVYPIIMSVISFGILFYVQFLR